MGAEIVSLALFVLIGFVIGWYARATWVPRKQFLRENPWPLKMGLNPPATTPKPPPGPIGQNPRRDFQSEYTRKFS